MGNVMLEVVLLRNNVLVKERCTFCGEVFDSDCVIAGILEEESSKKAKSHTPQAHSIREHHKYTNTVGYVCERCIEAGKEGVKKRMLERAKELSEYACWLRQKAKDDFELPTIEEYRELIQKEEKQLEKQFKEATKGERDWADCPF